MFPEHDRCFSCQWTLQKWGKVRPCTVCSAIPGTIPDSGPLKRAVNRGVNQLFVSRSYCVCVCVAASLRTRGRPKNYVCTTFTFFFLQQESRVNNPFCWKVEVSVRAQVQFKIYIVVCTVNQVVILHNEILIMFTPSPPKHKIRKRWKKTDNQIL